VLLTACCLLWTFQRVMLGPLNKPANRTLADLSRRELALLLPIVWAIFWIGLYPHPLLVRTEHSVTALVAHVSGQEQQEPDGRAAAAPATRGLAEHPALPLSRLTVAPRVPLVARASTWHDIEPR